MTNADQLPTIAIVGSGPAGCYTAQFMRKRWPLAEVTMFEALPAPYGLVRYGIAPDHQGTKAVTRQFDRLFERDGVRFVGNTAIGRDLSFEALSAAFDVVVLATGLRHDRRLEVPIDAGAVVIGAGSLIRALNAYPSVLHADLVHRGPIGRDVAIVGAGNVAIDALRLLVKQRSAMHGSDVHDDALDDLRPAPLRTVHLISRSAASAARFDLAMIREVLELEGVAIVVDGVDPDEVDADGVHTGVGAARALLDARTPGGAGGTSTSVRFHFRTTPTAIRSRDGRTVLQATDATGAPEEFDVDAVVTAIGFGQDAADDPIVPDDRWDGDHVHRVGWVSGSHGALPGNRTDAKALVDVIVAGVAAGRIPLGRPGFAAVAGQLDTTPVDFAGWKRIDAVELATAPEDRCRRKVSDVDRMIAIAGAGHPDRIEHHSTSRTSRTAIPSTAS